MDDHRPQSGPVDSSAPTPAARTRFRFRPALNLSINQIDQQELDELLQSHEILASVIDGSADSIYVKDLEGRYLMVNKACANFVGLPPAAITGHTDYELFDPELAELFRSADLAVIETGAPYTYDDTNLHPDGAMHTYQTTKTPLLDRNGVLQGVIGISRDITERRKAEEDQQAAAAANAANRSKTKFLSRMSHELRTPLNVVLGFAQLLDMDELSTDQRESVDYIMRAARQLLVLVNELLDVTQFSEGHLEVSTQPTPIGPLLVELSQYAALLAESQHIEVRSHLDECPDLVVLADPQRLRQALLNLFSNAIKFNHEGGSVDITCQNIIAADPDTPRYIKISVRDSGPGLSAEQQAKLFTPFERLGAEDSGLDGAGLGLTAAKAMIEAMGGQVGVESVLGAGSTFWIELEVAD